MSKISKIMKGKSFQYKAGALAGKTGYSFLYEFEDGTSGESNHMTEESPFNVGDEVNVEVKGEFQGIKKLKLTKGDFHLQSDSGIDSAPRKQFNKPSKDDDFVPQTLTYLMGAALHATLNDPQSDGAPNEDIMAHYAVAMYNAREKAVKIIRGE